MGMNNVWFAFGLTLLAGLSTGIGGLIAYMYRNVNAKALSFILGLSAGVMIYVSFVEIFFEAKETLTHNLGEAAGTWATVGGFFGGMLLIAAIDRLIPSMENPHEAHRPEDLDHCNIKSSRLLRTGLVTALAVTIHNFPEGLATFMAAMSQPRLGIAIAIAIAIHNIPEGIAVSFPIYCATGDRKKAFQLSFLTGLSEPVGAMIGYLIFLPYLNDVVFGLVFAAVAGIMVFISLDELLPTAQAYGEHHLSIYGLVSGMMLMALSLILFI